MSAPFSIGPAMADGWPMTSIIAGASTAPVTHAIDLARLFGGQGGWSDALVSETRRQLGGCINAVETGLRLTLEQDARVAGPLNALSPVLGWPTILANPGMVGPSLLAHMRMRAGLSLLLRQVGHAELGDDIGEEGRGISFASDTDPVVRDCAIELAMAEGRWAMAGTEDQPIRPDVPAEQFFDLVWMTVAALGAAMMRSGLAAGPVAMAAMQDAARAALARHDEGQGALAVADRLVWRLGDRAEAPDLLGQALVERRHLLFAALAGRHLGIATGALALALVAGPIGQVAALCHALGGSAPDYRHLLLALRPVRPGLNDASILALAADYGAIRGEQADAIVAELRAPEELRAKMAVLTQKAD